MESLTGETTAAKALSVVLRDAAAVRRYAMPNIKGGGILVETQDLLPMGTEVLLMLTLPDNQPRAVVMGKVVWVMPQDNREGHVSAIGVQFVSDRVSVWTRIQNALSGLPESDGPVLSF